MKLFETVIRVYGDKDFREDILNKVKSYLNRRDFVIKSAKILKDRIVVTYVAFADAGINIFGYVKDTLDYRLSHCISWVNSRA